VQSPPRAAKMPRFPADCQQAARGAAGAEMSDKRNLLEVKKKLAEKYEHLATISGSRPARKRLALRARKYRRQVENIARTVE
jgi:hypothetical protein